MANKDIIEEIKGRFCECSVCMSEYDEEDHTPRILPCNHTYCSECLSRLCKNYELKCPQCNALHKVVKNNIKKFRKDNTIRDLVTFASSKEDKEKCSFCSSKKTVYSCRSCDKLMCKECTSHHPQAHRIFPVNGNSADEQSNKRDTANCPKDNHERNELKYVCYSPECRMLICSNCAVEEHCGHDIRRGQQLYQERKAILASKRLLVLQKVVKFEEDINKLDMKIANLHAQIRKRIHTGELTSSLNQTRLLRRIREMDTKKVTISNFHDNAKECCRIVGHLLENADLSAFISVEEMLTKKLQDFLEFQLNLEESASPWIDYHFPYASITEERRNQNKDEPRSLRNRIHTGLGKLTWFLQFLNSVFWWTGKAYARIIKRNYETNDGNILQCILDIQAACFVYVWFILIIVHAGDPAFKVFGYENNSNTEFSHSTRNSTICVTNDRLSFSTIPFDSHSQTCKSYGKFYKYSGVFANVSFGNDRYRYFDIDVTLRKLKNTEDSDGIIFEFGFSTNIVHGKHLYSAKRKSSWGWSVKIERGQCFFMTSKGSYEDKVMQLDLQYTQRSFRQFRVAVLPNDQVISLRDRYTQAELDRIAFPSYTPSIWPVFAVFEATDFHITMKLKKSTQIRFNRTSAGDELYLSRDNSTISNRKFPNTLPPRKIPTDEFIYTGILRCKRQCLYMMKVRFDKSVFRRQLFEIGLTSQRSPSNQNMKDKIHKAMGNYTTCSVYSVQNFHCLSGTNALIVLEREWTSIDVLLDMVTLRAYLYVNGVSLVSTIPIHDMKYKSIYIRLLSSESITISLRDKNTYLLYQYICDLMIQGGINCFRQLLFLSYFFIKLLEILQVNN